MDKDVKDRIYGTILGSACANSLAGSCVGLNRKDIQSSIGPINLKDFSIGLSRSHLPDHQPGTVLSDTYLALELGECLIKHGGRLDLEDLKHRYSALLDNRTFLTSAPGPACLASLRRCADGMEPVDDGSAEATDDNGASRSYPLGCLPLSFSPQDQAIKQARLTQADSRVWAAAAVLTDSIAGFIQGQKLNSADEVKAFVSREFELANKIDPRFAESWDDVAPDLDYMNPAHDLPYSLVNSEAYVNELVPTAVGIFLIFRHNLEEAISAASCAGGATDSLGAIVGALSGAYHGMSAIPERWLSKVAERPRLEKLAADLCALW